MNTNSSASERMIARPVGMGHPGPTETKRVPVRIIVADSEAIFRVGMGKIFALEKDLEVVAQTDTLAQTFNVVSSTPADVILFEAGLSPNPAESVSEVIRRSQPGTKIIVISHITGE
ncbi:MAG TPA: hypothetical protein VN620_00235, partial [Candidatus Methylomirabilis sp.]|nr:hypothetical protein [Candidatus Methylomirabilis sp.]